MKILFVILPLILGACATSPSGAMALTTPAVSIPIGKLGTVSISANISLTPASNPYTTEYLPTLVQ